MFNRNAIICFFTGSALLAAKIATVCADPVSALTGVFPQIIVVLVVCALLWAGVRARNTFGKMSGLRWLLVICGLLMTGFILTIGWVDYNLAQRTYDNVYNEPYKVWATRGLVTDGSDGSPVRPRNSIASISYAFSRGARGTEVDVYYDPAQCKFLVSHSPQYEKPNGALLSLESLFDAVGEGGYFWLDWKRLRRLNRQQLHAALTRLKHIADRGTLKDRIFVEGEAPLSLPAVKQAGFQTIYDCHPLFDSRILSTLLIDVFKAVYYFGGFTVMGMQSGTREEPIYGPKTHRALRNIPVFLYHVPDDVELLKELASLSNVRVIIIRQDIDRFDFLAHNQ
jgi:hypothetical protein